MTTLDLALVGNGTIGALVDRAAEIVWCCLPRFDGDPTFCSLLRSESTAPRVGSFGISLVGAVRTEQTYFENTAILVTRMHDASGNSIEITDFAPRMDSDGTIACPMMLVRQVKRVAGNPVICVRVRPSYEYGCRSMRPAAGAGHIRYVGGKVALRLTTDAPLDAIEAETGFPLTGTVSLIFGGDEDTAGSRTPHVTEMLDRTAAHWRGWVDSLRLPEEWRAASIRAAITLQLNVFESTGAIIAAMTTSIPEAPNSGRTWDYRYCWPRDAWFVVDALSRLGDLRTTARYLRFLLSLADETSDSHLRPLYRIDGGPVPEERQAECLSGYRGMGPVRIGNEAREQFQHDIYGEAVLTAERMFLSSRSGGGARVDEKIFERLEAFGEHAARLFDVPDAGLWELRGIERVHTFSSLMCWAACDRLARFAERIGLSARAEHWRSRASHIHEAIDRRSWNEKLHAFTAAMEGDTLDASLLLMPQLGFLKADDPRFVGTVAAIERDLRHGDFVYRYVERDHLGRPSATTLAGRSHPAHFVGARAPSRSALPSWSPRALAWTSPARTPSPPLYRLVIRTTPLTRRLARVVSPARHISHPLARGPDRDTVQIRGREG